jgi:hypothetical protein
VPQIHVSPLLGPGQQHGQRAAKESGRHGATEVFQARKSGGA